MAARLDQGGPKLDDEDRALIVELGRERERLLQEAAKISAARVAEKWECSRSHINNIWQQAGLKMRSA